jgi:hypothetical protein
MKSNLQTIIEDLDYECRSYSGRGMFGSSCLAFEIDDLSQLLQLGYDIAEYASENNLDVSYSLGKARWDNMGHDYIIYFPGVEYHESGSEESEESDND